MPQNLYIVHSLKMNYSWINQFCQLKIKNMVSTVFIVDFQPPSRGEYTLQYFFFLKSEPDLFYGVTKHVRWIMVSIQKRQKSCFLQGHKDIIYQTYNDRIFQSTTCREEYGKRGMIAQALVSLCFCRTLLSK